MEKHIKNLIASSPYNMISYADYIAAALYHPEEGYYMNSRDKIGREGDFFTTSNISSIFGRLVAKWYESKYGILGLPAAVCEIGGGNGRFAQAFLKGWHSCTSTPLSYHLVETSPYHRELQEAALEGFEGVSFYREIEELGSFEGLVFSNELFDALPVHVIQKKQGKLHELMVTVGDEGFFETSIPLENEAIDDYLRKHGITLEEGQRLELPLEMENVVKNLASAVSKGLVVTVDYGYTNEEWRQPARSEGSLRGYYRHQMKTNILERPGSMDITSHVHFDPLIQQGEEHGLRFISKARQDEFLIGIGILDELAETSGTDPFSEKGKRNRAIKSLILPGGISSSFHVLIQGKGEGVGSEALK
ncbi:cytoplasmic protein [Mesobacillus campisalis]|uniref:Cytoplasmic protein n=1 Tax=Mesobacillus campisalis TaxID=1408103 RepID=A0A0M2SFZ5_9BACI|nr:SAM-dependent methyltransferase [Mesobacillus campisalis]KKK33203.1 cytoplasmic protein [Mesobacillus campisalis]